MLRKRKEGMEEEVKIEDKVIEKKYLRLAMKLRRGKKINEKNK